MSEKSDHYKSNSSLISICCGAPPLGEVHDDEGICRHCRDHATFEEDDSDDDKGHDGPPYVSC